MKCFSFDKNFNYINTEFRGISKGPINTECPFYPVPEHGSSITQKASSAGTYREGCSSQGHNKRDISAIIYNTTDIRGVLG